VFGCGGVLLGSAVRSGGGRGGGGGGGGIAQNFCEEVSLIFATCKTEE
jgi:hypothetical protein